LNLNPTVFRCYPALVVVIKIEAPLETDENLIKKSAWEAISKDQITEKIKDKRISCNKVRIGSENVWFVRIELTGDPS